MIVAPKPTIMDETALHQANQAYLDYALALAQNAPTGEQIRLLEQWHFLYWQVTLRTALATKVNRAHIQR